MRHRASGKHLGRTPSHRRALRRNLAASLFQHGAIRTTEAKAKDLRRFVERLITIARQDTLHARRRVIALLQDRAIANDEGEPEDQTVVQKLFDEIAPRYVDRPGGYTRIIRLSDRRIGDAGVQVVLQLIEESAGEGAAEPAGESRRKRRAAKRREAAELAEGEDEAAELAEGDQPEEPEAPDEQDEDEDEDEEEPDTAEGETDEPEEDDKEDDK